MSMGRRGERSNKRVLGVRFLRLDVCCNTVSSIPPQGNGSHYPWCLSAECDGTTCITHLSLDTTY